MVNYFPYPFINDQYTLDKRRKGASNASCCLQGSGTFCKQECSCSIILRSVEETSYLWGEVQRILPSTYLRLTSNTLYSETDIIRAAPATLFSDSRLV